MISIENFTSEEKVNELNQQNQFINKTLVTMAHDIRIPLNTTSFLIEQQLQSAFQPPEQKQSLQVLKSNSKITMGKLNDIMNFYWLHVKQNITLIIEKFPLGDLIREIQEIVKIIAKMKNIQFFVSYSCLAEEIIINSDQQKILQILLNLILNALKYAPNGEITLKISLQNSSIITFKVMDNGCGLSNEMQFKIQNGIFNMKSLSNDQNQGVGLGLYISRQILPYIGPCQHFKIKSEINQGASFSFQIFTDALLKDSYYQLEENNEMSLNTDPQEADKCLCSQQSFNINCKSELNLNQVQSHILFPQLNQELLYFKPNKIVIHTQILIVDDQPFNIYVLKMQLLKLNPCFPICEAFDGEQALRKFEQFNSRNSLNQIQLIFMDSSMPIMDGYEATRLIRLKCKNEDYQQVNIGGYTSLLTAEEQNKCEENGMDYWLQKPASYKTIEQIISKYYDNIINE